MKKVLATVLTVATILGVTSGCKKKLPKFELDVGDTVTLGKYQDEDIEWEVINRNFVIGENKVIVELQSVYALDCLPFNEDGESSWEDCSLREWLNNDFYEEAFSKSEKKEIIDTSYSMYTGDARWLTDKVYLSGEYLKYRLRPMEAVCEPTDHVEDLGIRMEGESCMYWTRDVVRYASAATTGVSDNSNTKAVTSFVLCLGTSNNNAGPDSFTAEDVGVRPWISVEYDATFEMKDIDVADRVTFGTYTGEPITWIVLESDKNGLNLLSKYGLEKMKMDKNNDVQDFADTHLHDWLNENFYEAAFSKSDKKLIVPDDDDDNVTLIEKISVKEGFPRECVYEMFNGYSKIYCEDNEVTEKEALDTFWCKGKNKKGDAFLVFDISKMGTPANSDKEYSVRPMITIKF